MKHIFYINDLSELAVKKDSTILMALTFQQLGHDSYLLFEKDFYITNKGPVLLKCSKFSGAINSEFYVEEFNVDESLELTMNDEIYFHMRIDPPYDSRYQRYLWMQEFLMDRGVKVLNNPLGIMMNNEKLEAYKRENSLPSYLGSSWEGAKLFIENLVKEGHREFIFKPLDLFQGIGVEKVSVEQPLEELFKKKCKDYAGPVVIQAFEKKVTEGEIRAIYFKSHELGAILKTPKAGEFLANIAQGAEFVAYEMSAELKQECEEICQKLSHSGVDFIAFDILGGKISEVNVTCPGLLVEVSKAMQRNLAVDIANLLIPS